MGQIITFSSYTERFRKGKIIFLLMYVTLMDNTATTKKI